MKKVKFLSVLTACAMLCGMAAAMPEIPERASLVASAEEYTKGTGEGFTYLCYDDHIMITSITGAEVVIPDEIDGIPVTEVDGCNYNTSLISLTLSNNLESLPDFYRCENLATLILPENLKSINDGTFTECTSLTNITIPDSVTYIGDGAFEYCRSLTTINIPANVQTIGDGAFGVCENLEWIKLSPDNPYFIYEDGILMNAEKTTLIASAPKAVSEIYTIPETVTRIGDLAFSCCDLLRKLQIPNSVTSIGGGAFYGCGSLTEISIPEGVTSLTDVPTEGAGYGTFAYCKNLRKICLPSTISETTYRTFEGCQSLMDIYFAGTEEEWDAITIYCSDGGLNFVAEEYLISYDFPTIHYNSKCTVGTYGVLTYQSYGDHIVISDCEETATEVEIPAEIDGVPVTEIGDEAFYRCENLTTIMIPDGVTCIGEMAFSGCSNLEFITIPDSVTSIGYNTFEETVWLENQKSENPLVIVGNILIDGSRCTGDITIPDNVESIADLAFRWSDITSVIIPNSVKSIGFMAFEACSLTAINIPESVTEIGERAFSYCSSLTSITVSNNNTKYSSIDGVLFNKSKTTLVCYPDGLAETHYTIPDGVTNIGDGAFYGCKSLISVDIPEGTLGIGSRAFTNCFSLTSISIPDGVTYIGDSAFHWCSSLTDITIPDSVTSIESYMFLSCMGLTSVKIPVGVTNIREYSFYGCDSLTDIYYPGTEEEWSAIAIGESNDPLFNATIHYNYTPEPALPLGDLSDDGVIDANDASMILVAAAAAGSGADSGLTEAQIAAADLNADGQFDASDASLILMYAAYAGAGGELDITGFLAQL